MPMNSFRSVALGALLSVAGLGCVTGAAQAQPVPPALPWMPGAPLPVPGSFQYNYNVITVAPPTAFDARGIRAVAGVDPAMAASGMPGSALGLGPNKPNILTSSSTRYGIAAGSNPSPALPTVNPGTNIGAGMEVPTLEDPAGSAPKTPVAAESSQPTGVPAVPGQPAPILEAANGTPAPATPSTTPAPPAAPPTPEVAAQSPPPVAN